MSYQPFSRADRNRWRRNETPRRALYLTEWHGRRFAAWARRNPSARWHLIDAMLAGDDTPPEVEAALAAAREAFKLRWGAP